jgi:hypothetical protein
MKLQIEKPSKRDAITLSRQCGKNMARIYGIAVRCPNGYPQVVIMNPVCTDRHNEINYDALANIVWLTCPAMKKKIEELERRGMIAKIEQMLEKSRELASKMNDAHAHFYFFRKEIFRSITGGDFSIEILPYFDTGIGGIKDVKMVKCLHIHYAHYRICQHNAIGCAVEGLIREQSLCGCEECQCRVQ